MEQDWNTVVWKKAAPKNAKEAVGRSGYTNVAKAKNSTISNANNKLEGQYMSKLDKTELGEIKKVPKKVGDVIRNTRNSKKLNQKAFAVLINEKVEIVANFESGKAKYNQMTLNKMERHLGVYLSGSNLGEPKVFGKK